MIVGRRPFFSGSWRWILLVASFLIFSPAADGIEQLCFTGQLITFHDNEASEIYGPVWGAGLSANFIRSDKMVLAGELSYLRRSNSPDAMPFVSGASTTVQFVPARLRLLYEPPKQKRFSFGIGPQIALALVRETWQADVAPARISRNQSEDALWLGLGAAASLRLPRCRVGTITLRLEWMWSYAERATAPGNEHQKREMTGGWSGLTAGWDLP